MPLPYPTCLDAFPTQSDAHPAGAINKDAPHRFRRGGKKVAASVPLLVAGTCERKPGLVHQGCGLEIVARRFVCHLVRGELGELLAHQRQQFLGSVRVARLGAVKDARDVAHEPILTKRQRPKEIPKQLPHFGFHGNHTAR